MSNITIAGASPNVTSSARESSCTPSGDVCLSSRAAKPSRKSKIAAAIINQNAVS